MLLFSAETETFDADILDQANALLQPFLTKYLDETLLAINQGETEVAKSQQSCSILPKPYGASLPGRALGNGCHARLRTRILGMGESEAWEDFLPTFRDMLKEFQLSAAERGHAHTMTAKSTLRFPYCL